jgi:hypothetical protein
MLKRVIYLGYYLRKLDFKQYWKFLYYSSKRNPILMLWYVFDSFLSVFIYNISLLEYFQFGFNKLNHSARLKWAGTGFMFEFQLLMNPKKSRVLLDDKRKFFVSYRPLFSHQVYSTEDIEVKEVMETWQNDLENLNKKFVFKQADGKCGRGVTILSAKELKGVKITEFMKRNKFDLLEEYIVQHEELMKLSPSGVNTIRIFTQLDSVGKVCILGCRLRISVNSHVDNMAAGNLAASVDEISGIVNGFGYYSDTTKSPEVLHPVSNVKILGFKIPFWDETIELVRRAALLHPQNRSIGWDIAVTDIGPTLIEGNHDWCKLLWQLPVQKGLKNEIVRYV